MTASEYITEKVGAVSETEATAVVAWCRDWCADSFEDYGDDATDLGVVVAAEQDCDGGLAFVLADVRRVASTDGLDTRYAEKAIDRGNAALLRDIAAAPTVQDWAPIGDPHYIDPKERFPLPGHVNPFAPGAATSEAITCPECGAEVWDKPLGHKLAKCWNAEAHASGGTLAFDTMSEEEGTRDAAAPHWHVASGLAGYGPDGADGFASFDSLGDAIDYARDELTTYVDMAHQDMHASGEAGEYEAAWQSLLLVERLELLRANLDPARASAPLYRGDPAAYRALQESQADEFPHDVSHNARLYLWECAEPDCEHCED